MINNIRKRFGATASVVTLGLAMGTNAVTAESLDEVMERRGLSQKDLLAAAKTYTPTGGRDEFIVFSSGGQSGQVMVYGVPSMRILKYVSVFTPEPGRGLALTKNQKQFLNPVKSTVVNCTGVTPTTRPSPKPTVTWTGNTCSSTTNPPRVSA